MEKILRKMCELVGAPYEQINFKSHDWYLQYSWDPETENQFKEWLFLELKSDKDLRILLGGVDYKKDAYLKKIANQFTWNYGWKTK